MTIEDRDFNFDDHFESHLFGNGLYDAGKNTFLFSLRDRAHSHTAHSAKDASPFPEKTQITGMGCMTQEKNLERQHTIPSIVESDEVDTAALGVQALMLSRRKKTSRVRVPSH